jgi:hypothetical protein
MKPVSATKSPPWPSLAHATDIYHGSGYFDRRKQQWSDEWSRWIILTRLALIIESMKLPIVAGIYLKENFGIGVFSEGYWRNLLNRPSKNQLADLVAFTLGRLTKNKPVISVASAAIENQLQWMKTVRTESFEMEQSS